MRPYGSKRPEVERKKFKKFLDEPSGRAERKKFLDEPSGRAERKKFKDKRTTGGYRGDIARIYLPYTNDIGTRFKGLRV